MATFDVEGPVGRAVRKVATSPRFRAVAPKVLPPVDRTLHRLSGGRIVLSKALLPSLLLTTTGRRTGRPRQTPLACLPDEDGGWYVVGSNFGRADHPAWTSNLLADPAATVSWRRRDVPVRAELLDADAKAAVWPRLTEIWPAYDDYVRSADGRDIRVFHLRPTTSPSAATGGSTAG